MDKKLLVVKLYEGDRQVGRGLLLVDQDFNHTLRFYDIVTEEIDCDGVHPVNDIANRIAAV